MILTFLLSGSYLIMKMAQKPLQIPTGLHLPDAPSSLPPPYPRHRVTYPTHVSPERGGRTKGQVAGLHPSLCAIFIIRYEPDRRKVRIISENSTRYRREFLRVSQAYNLTWNDVYYILSATLTPDEKTISGKWQKPVLIIYITKTRTAQLLMRRCLS